MRVIPTVANILDSTKYSECSFVDILKEITEKESLLNITYEILNDYELQTQIALRSYNHANGFYKIILFVSEDFKLRLHVWLPDKDGQYAIENIHYHRWKFVSKILLGNYTCIDYKIALDGIRMKKYIYYPRNGYDEYELVSEGVENLLLVQTRQHFENDFLISRPYELHRVIPNRNVFTASMLLQGRDELPYSCVYNEEKLVTKTNSPSLQIDELRTVLTMFQKELNTMLDV